MPKKEEKKATAVEPRIMQIAGAVGAKIISDDQADSITDMENVMGSDLQGRGRMFANNRKVIEDSYTCPGFQDDGRGGMIEPIKERVVAKGDSEEEVQNSVLLKRFDCTHGCNGRETVQPINSTGQKWECSECGKRYDYTP